MDPDHEYLRRRELHERLMARRARCKRARRVHHHLASIYATRRAAIIGPVPAPSRWQALRAFWRDLWC